MKIIPSLRHACVLVASSVAVCVCQTGGQHKVEQESNDISFCGCNNIIVVYLVVL